MSTSEKQLNLAKQLEAHIVEREALTRKIKGIEQKIDSSTNVVTIEPTGSETIDGEATIEIITQWTSLRLQSDGNNWVIL